MKHKIFLIAVFLALLPFSAKAEKLSIAPQSGSLPHIFHVEVADHNDTRARGLMFRKNLAKNRGMYFVFDHPQVAYFWMKNTLIPLDMIFIGSTGAIVKIHHNAKPGDLTQISSDVPVKSILEINGGIAKRLGLRLGDMVTLDRPVKKPEKINSKNPAKTVAKP